MTRLALQQKEERLLKMEDFLPNHWFQLKFRMAQFQWARDLADNNRLVNTSWQCFIVSALLNAFFFTCNLYGVVITTYQGVPSNQNPPVLSITIYFGIRGMCLYFKRNEIANFINVLDREMPKNLAEQRELKLMDVYDSFKKRYLFVSIYAHSALVSFSCLPLAFFFLTNEGDGDPITLDQQMLGGWLPFNLKQNHHVYLLVWLYDIFCTICGISFFVTYDLQFNVMHGQLIMHLDYLTRQLEAIDTRESLELVEDVSFYAKISRLAARHKHLNSLCIMYNDIFKGALLVGNFICAGAICFHLYLITETSDLLNIIKYIFPTLALVGFTFDLCLRGTQLEDASNRIQMALYNQNWYMGSRKYRKLMLLWLQNAQHTRKLDAYGLIQVNMEHFTDIMQLAYRLFTFLKSH